MTNPGPKRATQSRGPRSARTIHLIDVENLCKSGCPDPAIASAVRTAYGHTVGVGPDDLVVLGTNPLATLAAHAAWGTVRNVVKAGPNGADLALLDVMTSEDLATRFDHVTLASGDGIFTDIVGALGAAGCKVTVVARRGSLSRRLQMAATEIVYLELTSPAPYPATLKDAA